MAPELVGTGAVASRGCVTPAPGRARKVMRTVSFFNGTADVLAPEGGGMAAVFDVGGGSSSLMEECDGSENRAGPSI